MGSNTFPQQQSMGQMPQQMAPMQQQDQQTGFSGMYAPQYGSMAPSSGFGMQSYNAPYLANMQGYGGGQSVQNNTPTASYGVMPQQQAQYFDPAASNTTQQPVMSYGVMPQQQAQYFDPAASNMGSQSNQAGLVAPQIYNQQAGGQYFDPMVSDMAQQGNQAAPVAPQMYNQQVQQSVPNYQVPQVQQQPVAGYGGYAQQPMQNNPYGGGKVSSRQGPQRLY